MDSSVKRKIVAGAVAGVAVASGGVAIAATQIGSSNGDQAILNDAAKQLGVQPSALSNALKKALENRIDAEVAAGRLTKEQGDALKARIESGELPIFGPGGFGHFGHFGHFDHFGQLDTAATYLGLTAAELRTQLESGKTLAQVAKDRDKSVDGLIQAMVDAANKKIDAAVTAGRLTKEQASSIKAELKQRITDFVNGKGFRDEHAFRFRGRGFSGYPPPWPGPRA